MKLLFIRQAADVHGKQESSSRSLAELLSREGVA